MPPAFRLHRATPDDAAAIAELRCAVADDLTARFGKGHWSHQSTERGTLWDIRSATVLVAKRRGRPFATLVLSTRKPWAIDTGYFTPCHRPLYLTGMAVAPTLQGSGIGRRCLALLPPIVRKWPADAIRLDAYDSTAGAGGFYEACGYREVGRVGYKGNPLIYFEQMVPGYIPG